MKFLSLILLVLLLAVGIGSIAGSDTGYMLFSVSGWTIQTSATFFIIILLLGFILAYVAMRGVFRLIDMPNDIRTRRKHRRRRRAEKYLTEGLINMIEGRWQRAERAFCKAAPYSRSPFVNYLCAAKAAQESGAIDKRDDYLRLAYHNNPDAKLAVGITQAELQLQRNQTEQALATLTDLQNKQPDQIQVKQLLLNTYTMLNDWRSILGLIPSIEKTGVYSREQIQAKQLDAYAALLKNGGTPPGKVRVNELWSNIPGKFKRHPYLIEVYVNERLKFDHAEDCELLIRNAISRQWDRMLVRLYGLVKSGDPGKQLSIAESWLPGHARDPVLLLTLARLCMLNRLWGKAKVYLQESIDIQPDPEAYYEYAKLHEHEGEPEQATVCLEKGLALATNINSDR